MNNVFLRDRMERNNSDFEGSGIGEGRFDEYEEEKAKFSDAILPFIILTFMIIGLAGIIYLHITEIRKISGATAVEIECDGKTAVCYMESTGWKNVFLQCFVCT